MKLSYSLKRDGHLNLSPNFKIQEFRCLDGSDTILIDDALVTLLQSIRDHYKQPVTINSAYRTSSHNAAVGGSPGSQHLLGTAADITVAGVEPLTVCQYAEHLMPSSGGIGLYGGFAHVDVRANRSRWDQRSGVQVGVGGFPGYDEPAAPQEPEKPAAVPVRVLCPICQAIHSIDSLHINGQTYAPIRQLCNVTGYDVHWSPDGIWVTGRGIAKGEADKEWK